MSVRLLLFLLMFRAAAEGLPGFDFTRPEVASIWKSLHDVELVPSTNGLVIRITGADPYLGGPAADYPFGLPLWMVLEAQSDSSGSAQLFWSGPLPESESRSVRFFLPGGSPTVVRIPVPALEPGTRLRFDPPGTTGRFILRSLRFEPRPALTPPGWVPAVPISLTGAVGVLKAGNLTLRHASTGPGAFRIDVEDEPYARGHTRAPVGYQLAGQTRWFDTGSPMAPGPQFRRAPGSVLIESRHSDPDGAIWTFQQEFRTEGESIRYRSRISVDQDRQVVFAPALLVLPGVGSFGTNKHQAVLAGIEYLENEESSSERDLIGLQARRQVPDPLKFTFPFMAIAARGHWLSLSWKTTPHLAAIHDTPDRITRSGGHLFGLIHPGADPTVREDGSLLPYGGHPLKAGEILTAEAWLAGGPGTTLIPALQAHVRRVGLPPLPKAIPSAQEYYRLAARGWLDSGIREGHQYRHAVGNGFGLSPAPDAGYFEAWLASRVQDPTLAERLVVAAHANAAAVPDAAWLDGPVSHLRLPSPALLALKANAVAESARAVARLHLDALGPETRVLYRAPAKGEDLGRTHWTNHANGLTATHLSAAFDHALLAGDPGLVNECVAHLRRMARYDGEVPRGAQTWEVPLHTADILASAYLVKIHVRGFELTGERVFLERARAWAWTGIPFVYLESPATGTVGTYSTTPVFGATQFVAPNWIGLPVQWCGLVYADALLSLAIHDRSLDWNRLAQGIALSGVQQVHPESDGPAMGCLPDSFELRSQSRNPVPINPGTLQPLAAVAYGEKPLHGFAAARQLPIWVIAPGPVRLLLDGTDRARFRIQAPPGPPVHVVVGGTTTNAVFRWQGQPLTPDPDPKPGTPRAFLRVTGDGELEVRVR
jgi:hypothetical protein